MLVVTVEIFPGGDSRRRQHIHTMSIVNESMLAENSRYDVWLDGRQVGEVRHRRSDGALVLIGKAVRKALRGP